MGITLQTDLLNAMVRVIGKVNRDGYRMPVYVDLIMAYYDFKYEILVAGILEGIGFYGSETRIPGNQHGFALKGLFENLDDFMSGDEERIFARKTLIDWARR